MVKLAQGLCRA